MKVKNEERRVKKRSSAAGGKANPMEVNIVKSCGKCDEVV